jgi:hypothetical protein
MNSTEYKLKTDILKIYQGRDKVWQGEKLQFSDAKGNGEKESPLLSAKKCGWSNITNIYAQMLNVGTGGSIAVQIKTSTSGAKAFRNFQYTNDLGKSPFSIGARKTTAAEIEKDGVGKYISTFQVCLDMEVDYTQACQYGNAAGVKFKKYFQERGINKGQEGTLSKVTTDHAPDFSAAEFKAGEEIAKEAATNDDLPF